MAQIERIRAGIVTTLLLAGLATLNVRAQSTAQITGVVRDNAGAVIPGASVTAIQTDTAAKRVVTTNSTGHYILGDLPIGPYRLEASASGFSTYVQTGIVLQVNSDAAIDPTLSVGQVTQTVEIKADAAMVETQNPGVGTVVDNQRVLDLPLNGREVQQLVLLVGMATVATGPAAGLNSTRRSPTVTITAAGGTGDGITYTLDGVNQNDPYDNQAMQLPIPDALQEFKVETGALAAQYGYHSNAAVNAVTKSGTNSFHGTAFEFVRNGDFDATNYFATARDTLKRNQFGGVIGGPIMRDRMFFFASYQDDTERSDPGTNVAYVPTAAMYAGNFTTITSPACNSGVQITLASKFPDGSAGFVNNQISPSRFDTTALSFAKYLPTTSDPCGKVQYGEKQDPDEGDWTGRLDYQLSSKHFIFARTTIFRRNTPSSYDGKDVLTLILPASGGQTADLALGDTYLIGANKINSFRASINRATWAKTDDNFYSWSQLGANITQLTPILGNTTVGGAATGFNIGYSPNSTRSGPNTNLVDDFSLVKGPHQIGIGVSYIHTMTNFTGTQNCGSHTSFDGSWTESNSKNIVPMADFLMGRVVTFTQGNCNVFYDRQNYIGVYAQDVWKLNQHLTVSYGVRWEPYISPYSQDQQWLHFDPTLFTENVHSTTYVNGPAGLIFPGDNQYSVGNHPTGSSYAKFAPRIGFAWDPRGNGRLSIRAAYGIFTDRRNFYSISGFNTSPPYGDAITLSAVNLTNPWATYPGGNPFPLSLGKNAIFPLAGTYSNQPFNYHAPYMNQWNLNIQWQFGADWLLTANYVGNNTIHFPSASSVNPGVYQGTSSTSSNLNQRRVLYLQNAAQGQYYSGITQTNDHATGTYEGLLVSLQKRMSHNVSVLANDTWSHCISDVWDFGLSASGGSAPPPGLQYLWRGNCQTGDVRQVFNLSAVAATPRFENAVLRRVVSNWQLSPIMSWQSAQFFSVTLGTDVALTGQTNEPPIKIANPYPANQTLNNWINIGAFEAPPTGQYGTLRPFSMKGPGSFTLDTALSRSFAIPKPFALGEANSFLLRFEAFNILNHPVFAPPAAAMNSTSSFGKITTAGNPRILELAAKYIF